MKTLLKIRIVLLATILISGSLMGQLKEITAPNMISEANIYEDADKNLYSTLVTFKFNKKMIDIERGERIINANGILFPGFKQLLNSLRKQYGEFSITKSVPNASWGDTLATNRRTNEIVRVNDLSQIYRIEFENKVPIDEIVKILESSENIEYAEGPVVVYLTTSPNDPYYQDQDYRWSFDVINAEKAWDITTGSPLIGVGFSDSYGGVAQLHSELTGKVVWDNLNGNYGGHGIITAGVVGALTNNSTDIASLGWNVKLLLNRFWGTTSITNTVNGIYQLVYNAADVINFSWVTSYNYSQISDVIEWALQQGRICVASAGNDEWTQPSVRYPAAYNFGATGQVIAVSATYLNDGTEEFLDGFNYSPGTDPISNPTSAFIDFGAPGANYRALSSSSSTGTEHIWSGTSISAPFVSATVALMLSVNSTLTPTDVYEILERTSDKIGQYSYDANGWNRYLGYGRIDAGNAVNVANGAPSKPRGVTIAWYNNHPKITWDTNEEANIQSYKIWKYAAGSSMIAATVTHNPNNPTHSWVDYDVDKPGLLDPVIEFSYKVKAIDNSNNESIYSLQVSIDGTGGIWKEGDLNGKGNVITEFALDQNYPNPFNPSTTINYQLPVQSFVSIKIYNMLGETISVLKNEYQNSGTYSLEFDGSDLPSGTYLYKIQAGKYSEVKKMLLIK